MPRHPRSQSPILSPSKRARNARPTFKPIKVASAEAAARVDLNPPLHELRRAQDSMSDAKPAKGNCVVYWMRMADLRISDNAALSLASKQAQDERIPLILLFALSPQDYLAHDRSARRIDFILRNLSIIKNELASLHIPLHTISVTPRKLLPSRILSILSDWGCTTLYGNIEYEVDEIQRDIKVCQLAQKSNVKVQFVHNKCIIEPGVILTKEHKAYSVYSPYQRNWLSQLNKNIPFYLKDHPRPSANSESIHASKYFGPLFKTPVPTSVTGFELDDDDRKTMVEVFPAGEEVAEKILVQFLHTKARQMQLGAVNPLATGAETSAKSSRIMHYHKDRDRADKDTTSRLSVYLSAGVISARQCVRATMELADTKVVDGRRDTGIGRWIQEIAWRDFYTCVLASFPRVSMGRPFSEKFSAVVWENHQAFGDAAGELGAETDGDAENLKRWKEGTTGVPVVDATMRCINKMGWVHNRMRMITAMYLTKDLMIDWRVGERYFMQKLIDGDLASNNGGWQWSASTGVDPCPYFRIFNPYSQSPKADPTGDFIRHWVPELGKLRGPDVYNPPESVTGKLGYPRPIIKHEEARERALRRFKNPGTV